VKGPAERPPQPAASSLRRALILSFALALVLAGCTAAQHRKSADREVYSLLTHKEQKLFGHTNAFTIDTPYSAREPKDIPSAEILLDRARTNALVLTLPDALRLAKAQNRQYQLRKEALYLAGLALTLERYQFSAQPSAVLSGSVGRDSAGAGFVTESDSITVTRLLRSGGRLTTSLANDLTRYFTGTPGRTVTSALSVSLTQPLLRGFGADIAAEALTQAERDTVYDIRGFAQFQQTFASDIVTTYFRLLQRKDAVRNGWSNYQKLLRGREQAEALSKGERLAAYQVDQARQEEFKARVAYIGAVESYQASLDSFKQALALPLGFDIALDDDALTELGTAGLVDVDVTEEQGFALAVEHRMDLLNEIDRFEDSKRKVRVARDSLRAGLTFTADAALNNDGVNYAKFEWNRSTVSAGLQLDVPWDRLPQRNAYRATLVAFERQLRTLGLTLDSTRDNVRAGLRTLATVRQNYDIQRRALELAERRVDAANLLLSAGRAQVRDQLEAQTALVGAQNAVTQALVDHLAARLKLLIDIGMLNVDDDKFWLKAAPLPSLAPASQPAKAASQDAEVLPPEKVFGKP
jgi:outer membrane protein TolC